MLESVFGRIDMDVDTIGYTVSLRFISEFNDDPMYLTSLDERNLNHMIYNLQKIKDNFKKVKERRKEIMEHTDFRKIYSEMDRKYNPYPVQMTDADAFGHALAEGLIDEETYYAAREWSGKLWNYTGD